MKYFSTYLCGGILAGGVFLPSPDFLARVTGFLAITFLGLPTFPLGSITLAASGISLSSEGVRVSSSKLMSSLSTSNITCIRNKYDTLVVTSGKRKMKLREITRYIVS